MSSRIAFALLTTVVLVAPFSLRAADTVIINEIMYHPSSEDPREEYIELHNTASTNVNLSGWRFSSGVTFTFPGNTILGPGGYLVVAAHRQTFLNKYPGVTNVIGDWVEMRVSDFLGRPITNWLNVLSNTRNDIDLDDASGARIDSVEYADEGDWAIRQRGTNDLGYRGWTWNKAHDGFGKSLELINPDLPNQYGQNWAASLPNNGTPGGPNSVLSPNVPPLILEVAHLPMVPSSSDPVIITARILDEQTNNLTVTLFYRVDSSTPPPFSSAPMFDDGLHGDGVAADGRYGAVLVAQPNNTVIEFYVRASDGQANIRTWPGPVLQAADGAGPSGQVANALYQVDDNPQNTFGGTPSMQPVYKLIMTENERNELQNIPCNGSTSSDAQMNGTFISVDGTGTERHYLVGIRRRGHGSRCSTPRNYRVGFRSDDRWKSVNALNLNTRQVHIQHLGSVLALKAGVAGGSSRAVQVRVNNANLAQSGAPMFGSYAANEALNSDWAERHFPFDSGGNVYRVLRDADPSFDYQGLDKNAYRDSFFKETNLSEDDWTDLIRMLDVMGPNGIVGFSSANARTVINVEQWMRHLAVMALFANGETGLNSGYNDDYFMYRGVNDLRFILLYYDLDQILGQGGSLAINSSIFTATQNNGAGAALNQFMHWPEFEPIYYRTLRDLLDTTFSAEQFDAVVDQTLGSYASTAAVNAIKNWMNGRRAYVESILATNPPMASPPVFATVSGEPRSPTPSRTATLFVGGEGVTHYRFKRNMGSYGVETPVSTPIQVSTFFNNFSNTIYVIGKNANNAWQSTNTPTVSRTWIVNTNWPAVRINEVLARNDSALNHHGTFPDAIELYNEGTTAVDLSGLRLSDDPGDPNRFTFPAATTLAANAYLVVYANNSDGTPGLHLGFSLDQNGDAIFLYDRAASGGALLDSAAFGWQLPDLSIGRLGDSGGWVLNQPTLGSTNVARLTGSQRNLKINEWLAASQNPFPEDFVELVNLDPLPVALDGLYLTDQPIGAPALDQITPVSFMAGSSYLSLTADGDSDSGGAHLNFQLSSEQGEIALFNANLQLIDCVSYGPQRGGVSEGRCPDGGPRIAILSQPTPGFGNQCAIPPPPPQVVTLINMSNVWKYNDFGLDQGTIWKDPGFDDAGWPAGPALLGFDVDAQPEPVRTSFVNPIVGKMTFYFRTLFVVPSNTEPAQLSVTHLIDDGAVFYLNGQEVGPRFNMGPGEVTYLTPASTAVGQSTAYNSFAILPTNLQPGTNLFAVEVHQQTPNSPDVMFGLRLEGLIVTNNPAMAGIILNEVLANNASIREADGSTPDWVELYNPSMNAANLTGMSLGDLSGNRWVFPPGSIITAQGYKTIRLDADAPVSETNTGFGLKASGDALYLFNSPPGLGGIRDSITFGIQTADFSIGRISSGSNWNLTLPTPGATNIAATLGDATQLRVNEWMAAPASGDDWFEIYNPNSQPVALGGRFLSDSDGNPGKHRIDALSFIGAVSNAWQKFIADEPNTYRGSDHVNFKLAAEMESIGIFNTNGTQIDLIGYGQQITGVSQGRLPDGSPGPGGIVSFAGTASPGEANYLALSNIVVNEVLTHSDPPLEDAIELHNVTASPVNISGWWLSDSAGTLRKYQIPNGNIIPARGFLVFYENQFNNDNVAPVPFALNSSEGDQVYLAAATNSGAALTGFRAVTEFGPAANGVSFGRLVTSVGSDFVAMSRRSFGRDFPSSVGDFRMGTGLSNAYPLVGPVVISEIMYHPPDVGTNDNVIEEFIELHNITSNTVPLFDSVYPSNRWRLRDAVDFDFPPGTSVAPGAYLLLVSFDPLTNPSALATFQARYGTNSAILGPYVGKLDNGSERVELYKPDPPQPNGVVPYVLAERIVYGDRNPWPTNADGFGQSLQRINHASYGNDPTNWFAATPTPGPAGPRDRDSDGMPDSWETAYDFDPDNPNDAGLDHDMDGATNLSEYLAGTDPRNEQSNLNLVVLSVSVGTVTLRFTAEAGRTYSVQSKDSPDATSWFKIVDVPAQGVTQEITVTDPTAIGMSQRFYRLVTPQAP